jgi:glycosyltransferase involved in cell wall biosynthesis
MVAATRRVLTEPGLADDLRRRGQEQAASFSWKRVALETEAIYKELTA